MLVERRLVRVRLFHGGDNLAGGRLGSRLAGPDVGELAKLLSEPYLRFLVVFVLFPRRDKPCNQPRGGACVLLGREHILDDVVARAFVAFIRQVRLGLVVVVHR